MWGRERERNRKAEGRGKRGCQKGRKRKEIKYKDTTTHGSSSIQLVLLSPWASQWWWSQHCSSRCTMFIESKFQVSMEHRCHSHYLEWYVYKQLLPFPVCHSGEFLSRCINRDVQTKPHLLSGLELAPSCCKFLSSVLISHSWCCGLSLSKFFLVAFTVLEAIVIFNSLTGAHRVDQSWQGASTTQRISALPVLTVPHLSLQGLGSCFQFLRVFHRILWVGRDSQGMLSISYI